MTVTLHILPTRMHKPSEMAHTVALLTCIWMLPIVNLSWYKDYLLQFFTAILSHSRKILGYTTIQPIITSFHI